MSSPETHVKHFLWAIRWILTPRRAGVIRMGLVVLLVLIVGIIFWCQASKKIIVVAKIPPEETSSVSVFRCSPITDSPVNANSFSIVGDLGVFSWADSDSCMDSFLNFFAWSNKGIIKSPHLILPVKNWRVVDLRLEKGGGVEQFGLSNVVHNIRRSYAKIMQNGTEIEMNVRT